MPAMPDPSEPILFRSRPTVARAAAPRSIRALSALAVAMCLSLAPGRAAAQARDTTVAVDPVIVTASRTPTPMSSASQPAVVLSGEALRARGVTTVAQALREAVPGAAVVQSGSYGGVTSLFLRGGESRSAKILIDGVPVNSVGGAVSLADMTLDDVDRIEVVYGPGSALYGADAVTGTVQIFTRRAGRAPGLEATARGGTYGSRDATLSARTGWGRVAGAVGAGWHETQGIYAFNNRYRNGTLTGALDVAPDAATTVRFTTRYNAAQYHFPTDYTGAPVDSNSYTATHSLVTAVDAARRVLPGLTLRAIGGLDELRRLSEDTERDSASRTPAFVKSSTPSTDTRRFAEARAEGGLRGTRVAAGAAYQVERARTGFIARRYALDSVTALPGPTSTGNQRTTRSAYATLQTTPARAIRLDGSVRRDVHSDFAGVTTGRGGVVADLWSGARARLSYGTAFNAPAFYQTQGSVYNRPNPALQPERARSLDAGVEQALAMGQVLVSLGAFDQRFAQLIQYVPAVYGPNFSVTAPAYYDNLTSARSSGYEASLRIAPRGPLAPLNATASYTALRARVTAVTRSYKGSQRPGDALLRRPSHSARAVVSYAPAGWSLALSAAYVGRRADLDFTQFPSPAVTLPSYTRADAAASFDVARHGGSIVSVTARADNLLGRRYEEVLRFPAPGRAVFLGLRVTAAR